MNIVLNDKLEEIQTGCFECKGMKKGNISEAIEEAIEQWINSCETYKQEQE
jgi:hypothetical protein